MKKVILACLLLIMIFTSAYRKPYKYTIDAEKDAFLHNNIGLGYLRDRIYYAAIQEFKIAIKLSPNTQSTAIFMNNLGETYTYIGYPELARICFEDAIKLYGLNFKCYQNLVNCYKNLNLVQEKIAEYSISENTYDKIMLGLLYIENNSTTKGIVLLDEICQSNPELLITPAIKQYLKDVTTKIAEKEKKD